MTPGWGLALTVANVAWVWWRAPIFLARFHASSGLPLLILGAGAWGIVAAFIDPTAVPVLTLGWAGAVVDARLRKLPLEITLVLLGEVLVILTFSGGIHAGALLGAALWTLPLASGWALRQVGLGDVLLGPSLGLWLGAAGAINALGGLLLALLGAALWSLVAARRGTRRFALGPFLWAGAVAAWFGTVSHLVSGYEKLFSC